MSDSSPAATAAAALPLPSSTIPHRRYTSRQVVSGIWRLLVGIKDMLALLFLLLFFVLLAAILSARPNTASIYPGGALVLRLNGTVSEQPAPVELLAALQGAPQAREFRREDVVRALRTAATDARVKAVVLDLDSFMGGGQVAVGDIAEAVDLVRRANKPVLAYATGYSRQAYQLAAHASEIWTEPAGGVVIAGPGGSQLYYRGLMDRLGITGHIYRVGTFKSAVEPFLRSDQSPESREATLAYAGVVWEQWQAQVRRARPAARLDSFIADPAAAMRANGNNLAEAAKAAGLVDRIGSRLAFETRVGDIVGRESVQTPWRYNRIALDDWIAANPEPTPGWFGGSDRIAVIPVVGTIVDGRAPAGTAGGETIARHILDAVSNSSVKAIVLRVDSPGGSVLASERIRSALLQAKSQRQLPIVVSMANVAASGGYWIATPADRIIAEPDTITGSIGVFAVLPTFEGSLARLNVGADGIATTPLSGQPDLFRGTNAAFDSMAQANVENIYSRFTGYVAAARRLPIARVREIAEGRVWAGGTARQIGLVDSFGGLDDAVAEAARLARLDPASVTRQWFENEGDPFAALLRGESDDDDANATQGWFAQAAWLQRSALAGALTDARRLIGGAGVQADCLECRDSMAPRAPDAESLGWLARLLGI